MKNSLRMKIMLLLFALVVGCSNVWATDILNEPFNISGTDAVSSPYNGWTITRCWGGNGSIRLGASSGDKGQIISPALTSLSGGATLTFEVKRYSDDSGSVGISIAEGSGSVSGDVSVASSSISTDSWTTKTVTITGGSSTTKIKFLMTNKRMYLRNVRIVPNVSVTAPTVVGTGGVTVFDSSLDVTLTPASGTTMYYTTDGSTPSSSTGTGYTSAQLINITTTTTVKAIAYDNSSNPSSVTSVTFNKSLTTMDEIFEKATALGTSGGSVYITFNNWVVSGVSGNNAYVTDGTKGFIIYKTSHGLSVGDVLTGSKVQCTLKIYSGSAEITDWGTGFTKTTGGTVTEQVTTIDALSGVNTGSLIKLNSVTYNGTNLVDGNNHIIKPYTTLYSGSYSNGTTYNIIGVYQQYGNSEPHNILPRSAADIVIVPSVSTSVSSINFTYNYNGGPDAKTFTVSGSHLTANITVATNSENFEISSDGTNWQTSAISISYGSGTVSATTIHVRLKSGLSSNTYNGKITVSSTGAANKEITLTGTVKHTIAISGSITNGSVESDPSEAAVAGATVTLTADPAENYKLGSFTVTKASSGTVEVTPTGANTGTFEMPTDNVTVSATFIQAYTVTYVANGGSGTMTDSNSPYTAGTQVTLLANTFTYTGHTWSSWVVKDALQNTVAVSEGKFEMPSSAVTVTAQWTTNTHDITMPAANTYGNYTTVSTSAVPYGTEVELTYTPAEGYENYVAVWSVNGTPIAGNIFNMPDEDVTVTVATHATWTVTYNANGGTGSMSDPNSPYDNGDDVTVLANGFTYLNHTFTKWNTQADGKGTDYDPDDVIEGISENITLYAQWENGVHVTYTIESVSSVSVTGSAPLISSATYSSTYSSKYQLTSGKSMTLTLKGYQGQIIKKLTLNMKSNSSSGGGSMTMTIGKTTYASISDSQFNSANWNGAWSGTDYVDIVKNTSPNNHVVASGEDIVITISASENSLFCKSFTIDYETSSDPMIYALPAEQTINHTVQSITYGDKVFDIVSFNIATPTFALAFCDADGNVLGSNIYSSWFTPAITNNENVTYSVTANEGGDRTAYFKVYATVAGDPVYSTLCSVTQKHYPHTYILVDGDDVVLEAGKHYIFASATSESKAMGSQKTSNREAIAVTYTSSKINENDGVYEVVLSGDNTNYWTIYDVYSSKYLYASSSSSNELKSRNDDSDANSRWAITVNKTTHIATIEAKGTYTRKYLRYNSGSSIFSCYGSSNDQSAVYIYVREDDKDLEFYSPTTIASATIAADETYTIESGQVLEVTGTLTNNGTAANLIIEDGGQLFTTSAVPATIKQSIASATSKDDVYGWYTISSPVADVNITANTNLTENTYNLLRYNETGRVWENYNNPAHSSFGNTLEEGRGYLYRNSEDITLEYSGTINNSTVEYTVTNNGGELAGFNLIGNPYTHDIYKGASGAVPNSVPSGYALASGFYTLTKEGEWHAGDDNEDAIKSGQGFLVKATTGGKITMSNVMTGGPAKGRANHDNIKFIVENNQYSDVAYAVFDKGISLNKINHRNPNSPMLYIPQAGDNYALAMMSDDTRAFNLNFKAMSMGQYTLSLKANGEFDYIHIIDLLTGEDVDMLLEGKYTFIGTPSDSDNRFIVKLAYNSGNTSSIDESFAYQSGSDIHVTGSGELQIFDVTGRMVMTTTVNGAETINLSAHGVYIFRLIGTEIKTQKIVVR